jgi:DNA-binding CsgD family transcriptional regulator/PAS domain-containing protein
MYAQHYQKINPLFWATLTAPVGAVISLPELMPYEEWQQTTICREWAEPQGLLDGFQINLEKSATAIAFLFGGRGEPADEELRRRAGLLSPHFRRAILIGKVIDLHKVEAAALADTLDGLAAAMLLVDCDGRIVHANTSGQALLARGRVLRKVDAKIIANDPEADNVLRSVFLAAASGDGAIGGLGTAIPLKTAQDERYVAHVLPLTAGARRLAGVTYSAIAAVFVRKAGIDLPHPVEVMAGAYKLTPAELRVLMAITNVGGVPEVAPVLGISEETVKTHLKRIFEKTDTSRQADLVKLVAGYMSPLAR